MSSTGTSSPTAAPAGATAEGAKAGRPEDRLSVSVVIPMFNEVENVEPLVREVSRAIDASGREAEVILVDDGSWDGTADKLREVPARDPRFRIVLFRRNFGQTAAMSAGFDHARGDVIVAMDGDLQNDPADLEMLMRKIEDEGYDIVSGWRKDRKDKALSRKLPSRLANWLIGRVTGVRIHDYGCSLKAYRAEVLKHIRLYGEMHRFIPAIASWNGARITEMVVNHRPRVHGTTKYGLIRTLKVILDLITVKFLGGYGTKPIYFFGALAITLFGLAGLSGAYVIVRKLFGDQSMIRNPLLLLTVLLIVLSSICVMMGLLAELMVRTYHESQDKPTYIIRRTLGAGPGEV